MNITDPNPIGDDKHDYDHSDHEHSDEDYSYEDWEGMQNYIYCPYMKHCPNKYNCPFMYAMMSYKQIGRDEEEFEDEYDDVQEVIRPMYRPRPWWMY